jgi:ankyrin repeat protein
MRWSAENSRRLHRGRRVFKFNVIGVTVLTKVAEKGDAAFEIIKVLLDAGTKTNVTHLREGEGTALMAAVRSNGLKCVGLLLQAGADTSALGENDNTALHFAAEENENATIVDLLLEAGAEIDAKDIDGRTPLHMAANVGNNECVDMLLKAGADKNAEDTNNETPLYAAADAGESRCVELLLNAGANKDTMSCFGYTALIAAALQGKKMNVQGDTECVKLLVKAG